MCLAIYISFQSCLDLIPLRVFECAVIGNLLKIEMRALKKLTALLLLSVLAVVCNTQSPQSQSPPPPSYWDNSQTAGFHIAQHDLWTQLQMPALIDLLFADSLANYTRVSAMSARLEMPSGKSMHLAVSHVDHIYHYIRFRTPIFTDHAIIYTSVPGELEFIVEARPYAGYHETASLLRIAFKLHPHEGTALQDVDRARAAITIMTHSLLDCARARIVPFPCRDDFRSFAGTCNNVENTAWGAAFTPLRRKHYPHVTARKINQLKSAREISRILFSQKRSVPSIRRVSALTAYWGQFVDHDVALAPIREDDNSASRLDIPITDHADPMYKRHAGRIPFHRSRAAPDARPCCGKGLAASVPGNPPNLHSSFVDGSQIYGAERPRVTALRVYKGGQLLSIHPGPDGLGMLPTNERGDGSKVDERAASNEFLAGDERVNEQPILVSLHTMFLREHNRIATKFAKKFSCWSDEKLFHQARRIVSAQVQLITYRYFLPTILGRKNGIPPYRGYNNSVDPTLDIFFSSVAFRFGHSMIPDKLKILTRRNTPHSRNGIELHKTFFNPRFVRDVGIEALLLGASHQVAESVDINVVNSLQNELFKTLTKGIDLIALNIQRGRDHAIPSYNDARELYGLERYTLFEQITTDEVVVQALKSVYKSINDIDAYVGAITEQHVDDSELGSLIHAAVKEQFTRLRDGDRFYYASIDWPKELRDMDEVKELINESLRLSDIFIRNSGRKLSQSDFSQDVFRVESNAQIS